MQPYVNNRGLVQLPVQNSLELLVEPSMLVNNAVDVLVPQIPELIRGSGPIAARTLFETISRALKAHDENSVLDGFVRDPSRSDEMKAVLRQLVRHDPTFAAELSRVANHSGAPGSFSGATQVGNVVHGDMAGRDVVRTANNVSNTHQKTTNTGGVVLAVVVIAALLVGFFVIKALVGAIGGGGLGGSSTCQDFLASSDTQDQAATMKRLYLADGKPHLAADPFIIQNTEYYCGNAPGITLDKLASEIPDNN